MNSCNILPVTSPAHQEFIAKIDPPIQQEIQQLHDLITSIVPDWEQWETKGIMGWGRYTYQGASKNSTGEWFHIGLAANKTGLSVYIIPSDENGMLPEQAKDKLGVASIGKSCIRTKSIAKLNLEELTHLLHRAKAVVENGSSE